jgi:hypothetical protein
VKRERGLRATRELVGILNGERVILEAGHDHLISLAAKNKVLLHLLRALEIKGPSRELQERAMRKVTHVVGVVSRALDGFDYSFFKLVRPIWYVPADVDLLIRRREAGRAAKRIRKLGYRVVVKEPHCVTFAKGSSIIDLYTHPTLGGMAYMDGQKLLEHVKTKEYNGLEVRTLEDHAEALVAAAHAIYKERIYTLNDYFTVKEWSSSKCFRLAEELNCRHALELARSLNERIEGGSLSMPYKIPVSLWFLMLSRKLCADPLARATLPGALRTIRSPRMGRLILSKFTRQAY